MPAGDQRHAPGTLMGIPPTGEKVSINVIDIVRVRNGRYYEHWGVKHAAVPYDAAGEEKVNFTPMKPMSSQDIVSMRLQHQQISAPAFTEPEKVVEWMGCLQAQDYAMAKWAIGCRVAGGITEETVEKELNSGRILRTHVLRPTWHFGSAQGYPLDAAADGAPDQGVHQDPSPETGNRYCDPYTQ